MVERSRWRLLFFSFVLLLLVAFMPIFTGIAPEAKAAVAKGPLPFNQVKQKHYYQSSIDGATLPCSVYVPTSKNPLGLWVDLHAFGGHGEISTWWWNNYAAWANHYGWAILSPWGRNYKGMYADGKELGTPEPSLLDDFGTSESTSVWTTEAGNWSWDSSTGYEGNGCYKHTYQSEQSGWQKSIRNDCIGDNYTVSVDLRESSSAGGISAMGIILRRQGSNTYYQVDLCDWAGYAGRNKELRVYKNTNGAWTPLTEDPCTWNDGEWYNLKVNVFQDCLEVELDFNRQTLNYSNRYSIDPSESPYREGIAAGSTTVNAVGLASFGGTHQFDNFRVQNEFLYGETDIMDCIQQFIEEVSRGSTYRIDPTKIFISGYSMGGMGTWNLGLHYPDTFLALHPAAGSTDLEAGYSWIWDRWPDQTNPTLQHDQDSHTGESIKTLLDCEPSGITEPLRSMLRENSALYILENGLNTSVRIEHPEYDCLVPNTKSPMYIWLTKMNGGLQAASPATASASWANSKDIWQAWLDEPVINNGLRETSGYDINGNLVDPNNIWDNWDYSLHGIYNDLNSDPAKGGSHGNFRLNNVFNDTGMCSKIASFFNRVLTSPNGYYTRHTNPSELVYKTYDSVHNKAWWLTMDIKSPDANKPGLTKVSVSGNTINAHVKNVTSATLDLSRMGIDTTTPKTLTFNLDKNTAPYESKTIDGDTTWNSKVTLNLVGQWYPDAGYTVTVNGQGVPLSTTTGTMITIPDIQLYESAIPVQVTIPGNLVDMKFDNFATNPVNSRWWPIQLWGGVTGTFQWDTVEQGHGGSGSVKIRDVKVSGEPYLSLWAPSATDYIDVEQGEYYTASAFVRTRLLSTNDKEIQNGKYVEPYPSKAGVGILWYRSDKSYLGYTLSDGICGTNDWTPQDITNIEPPDEAEYAKLVLFIKDLKDPFIQNCLGSSGSAWFDDVRFSRSDGTN